MDINTLLDGLTVRDVTAPVCRSESLRVKVLSVLEAAERAYTIDDVHREIPGSNRHHVATTLSGLCQELSTLKRVGRGVYLLTSEKGVKEFTPTGARVYKALARAGGQATLSQLAASARASVSDTRHAARRFARVYEVVEMRGEK